MALFNNLFGTNVNTTTSSNTSSTQIPDWANEYYMAQIQARSNLYDAAKTLYNQNADFPVYQGQRLQGFTPDQLQAFQNAQTNQGLGTADLSAARSSFGAAATPYTQTYNPNQVSLPSYGQSYSYTPITAAQGSMVGGIPQLTSGSYNPMNVSAQNINPAAQLGYNSVNGSNVGISAINPQSQVGTQNWDSNAANAYMNPYTETAMQRVLDEMGRQSDIQGQADHARATSAGAFGGSRQAIMDAERERNLTRAQGDTAAQMMNQAYGQAQNMFTSDAARQLQSGQFNVGTEYNRQAANQQAGLSAGMANQQNALQAALANQNAGLTAGQFNINQDYQRQLMNSQLGLQAGLANQQAGATANQFNIGQNMLAQQGNLGSYMQGALANQQMSGQNAQMQNSMNLANAANNLSAYQTNADTFFKDQANSLATQIQNQNMGLQAFNANRDQSNTNANLALQAGQGYATLGPLAQNMANTDLNTLYGIGSLQQQFGQQNLNLGYNDFLMQQQYPYQNLAYLQSALQGSYFQPQFGTTTTSNTVGTTPGPSTASQIGGLGIAGLGLVGQTGGFGTSGWLTGSNGLLSSIGSWF